MKTIHEVCIERIGKSGDFHNQIQTAIGTDSVQAITHCDPRTFGENIQWHDGAVREITKDNVAGYFAGQGHMLVKIVGNRAFGNTIIEVETDDEKGCCAKIDAHIKKQKLAA